jgi:hypothetical protein
VALRFPPQSMTGFAKWQLRLNLLDFPLLSSGSVV